jgi:hypothetical protein
MGPFMQESRQEDVMAVAAWSRCFVMEKDRCLSEGLTSRSDKSGLQEIFQSPTNTRNRTHASRPLDAMLHASRYLLVLLGPAHNNSV